ncbi:hypothetical protein B0H14DRAFT_3495499 [Mycena olivaceomarginata]|nr:hypothetical protein B0H14DRAFT_3495499 [Mycena olivaceomarginata]
MSIEESELSEADQKRIGDAEEVMRGVIHNWINNRGQKEKKAIATNNPTAATSVPLRDLFVALGGKTTRIKQRTELWTRRNREELRDALEEENYASLMGVSDDEETPEERKERIKQGQIKQGQSRQMTLKRAVTQRLYDESPEEEKAAVEQIYLAQERKTKKSGKKAETPEEFQMGLDQLGSVLKQFHTAVTEMTGLVGGTVLVGPIPKEGGKIGTQSYCHGATAAGHTLDQAHPRWGEQVVNPLQQFGKKVFDHKTRREHALQLPETSEEVVPAGGRPDGETVAEETVPRHRRTNSRRTKHRYISRATSGDTTGSPNLNTDDLISFNNPGPGDYLHDMNGDSDSAPPLKDTSSDADMSMIDPVLRGLSLPASEDAGNEEPRPLESLGTPPFELRSMSADSPSHKDLAPLTQGFRFGEGVRLGRPQCLRVCPQHPPRHLLQAAFQDNHIPCFIPRFTLLSTQRGRGLLGRPRCLRVRPQHSPRLLPPREAFASACSTRLGRSTRLVFSLRARHPCIACHAYRAFASARSTCLGFSLRPRRPCSACHAHRAFASARSTRLVFSLTARRPCSACHTHAQTGGFGAIIFCHGPSSVTAGIRPCPGFDDTSVWANGTAHEFHHGTASCVLLDTERLPAFPPNVKRAADAKTSGFERTRRTYVWGDERAWGTGRARGTHWTSRA